MESQFASAQSIDIDGELKRWMTQLEVVETGVNNLFGQVQILRNGRYIRTEQVYRKCVRFTPALALLLCVYLVFRVGK